MRDKDLKITYPKAINSIRKSLNSFKEIVRTLNDIALLLENWRPKTEEDKKNKTQILQKIDSLPDYLKDVTDSYDGIFNFFEAFNSRNKK